VVDGKIFIRFGPIWPHQPVTNQVKKKVPNITAKTVKFKKIYHKIEFKKFPKITAFPPPDPQKPINPFYPAKSAENLAVHHLFFEIKARLSAHFTI